MSKYGAKPKVCAAGHKHPSIREATRCDELHLLQRGHEIMCLQQQPRFEFIINGKPVMMKNGQKARFTADFQYTDVRSQKQVVEDSKGFVVRDYPLRAALFRHLFPMIELREV